MRTKLTTIAYWGTTGVVAAAFVLGGAVDAAHPPSAVAFLAHLGYPLYFAVLIGVWKVLGGIAILAPRLPRLKEWAYAGILAYWIHDELWDVEVEGPAVEGVDCLVVARARLLRRIDVWTEGRQRFAQASIEHAAASLRSVESDAVRELLGDARVMATHGYPALASYTAAVAVARASGGDVVQRFRAERSWQSGWIAEYVGRG